MEWSGVMEGGGVREGWVWCDGWGEAVVVLTYHRVTFVSGWSSSYVCYGTLIRLLPYSYLTSIPSRSITSSCSFHFMIDFT